jgi:hypothetical protein
MWQKEILNVATETCCGMIFNEKTQHFLKKISVNGGSKALVALIVTSVTTEGMWLDTV